MFTFIMAYAISHLIVLIGLTVGEGTVTRYKHTLTTKQKCIVNGLLFVLAPCLFLMAGIAFTVIIIPFEIGCIVCKKVGQLIKRI